MAQNERALAGAHGPRWVWGWGRGQRSTTVPAPQSQPHPHWSRGSAAEHVGKGRAACTGGARDPGSLFRLASLGLAGSAGISPDSGVQVTEEGGARPQTVGEACSGKGRPTEGARGARMKQRGKARSPGWLSLGDESGEPWALGHGG